MSITTRWQTYKTLGYTTQLPGSSQESTGGVSHHQVRRTPKGKVLVRIVQTNGRHSFTYRSEPALAEQIAHASASLWLSKKTRLSRQ